MTRANPNTPYHKRRTIGIRACSPPMGKFMMLRAVCAPYKASEGTSKGPNVSLSVLVLITRRRRSERGAAVTVRVNMIEG